MIRICSISRKRGIVLFSLITIAMILLGILVGTLREPSENRFLIVRVDDIQDFAFKDAQLFLLEHSTKSNLPLSLAIIAGMFGEDPELLEAVNEAVAHGCEVGVHGWQHENLTNLSMLIQMDVLFQARTQLEDLLDVEPQLLIPPMFGYNNNTLNAMRHESFNLISTCTDYHEPNSISGITNIPATVELATLSNGIWQMKSINTVKAEVEKSFELYGYAAIVTHPQEFLSSGQMNQTTMDSFKNIMSELAKTCQFTTFEDLFLRKFQE